MERVVLCHSLVWMGCCVWAMAMRHGMAEGGSNGVEIDTLIYGLLGVK